MTRRHQQQKSFCTKSRIRQNKKLFVSQLDNIELFGRRSYTVAVYL